MVQIPVAGELTQRELADAQQTIMGGALAAIAFEVMRLFVGVPGDLGLQALFLLLAMIFLYILIYVAAFVIKVAEDPADAPEVRLTDDQVDELVDLLSRNFD